MNVAEYTTKSLDHLGLVSVLCKELGVAKFIDERLPKQSTQSHITHGELLCVLRPDPNTEYGNIRTLNTVLFEQPLRTIRTLNTAHSNADYG